MSKDKLRISTFGLPEIPKSSSKSIELLSEGYSIYFRDGIKFAKKNNEEIRIEE